MAIGILAGMATGILASRHRWSSNAEMGHLSHRTTSILGFSDDIAVGESYCALM